MKKSIKIIILTALLLGVGVLALMYYADKEAKKQQKRPMNVPEDAFWKGAEDEGFWIYIADLDTVNRTVRIKIYNDYNGELALDANFEEKQKCKLEPFTKVNISENIFAFAAKNGIENRDEIMLKNDCSLVMVKPALGGSFKDIVQNPPKLPHPFSVQSDPLKSSGCVWVSLSNTPQLLDQKVEVAKLILNKELSSI